MMTPAKVLIVRTDRVGDVLLTTPVGSALRGYFPKVTIHWLVRPYTAPLLEKNPDVEAVHLDCGQPLSELVQAIKAEHFDAALVVLPRWRTCWALWRAGVPMRIGPASKWYSLFLTHRLWQHRSWGGKHEADYNLDLLAPLGVSFKRYSTRFVLTDSERQAARQLLEGHRIRFQKPLVVLHPGSGGSSARWPLRYFTALNDRLQEEGCDVVVTAGPGENYQTLMIDQVDRIPVFVAPGSVRLRELGAIFSCANLVVSNSTGPLHMAVALGVPTVSVYSPLPTCHPNRWGPYPAWVEHDEQHTVLMPKEAHDLTNLDGIRVEDVLRECRKRLFSNVGARV